MNEKYNEIINLPHHTSKKRTPMSLTDRAAQFAPYSALSGFEDAIKETARLTDRKIELDEYEKEKINGVLRALAEANCGIKARITHFLADRKKSGGKYLSVCGEVCRIDEVKKELVLDGGYRIFIDEILDVEII